MIRVLSHRWNHWRQGQRDTTPFWMICVGSFGLGVTVMGVGEVILVLSS